MQAEIRFAHQLTICTLACMAAAAARTKCRRASTVTRTRAGGASNNFGNGFGLGYLELLVANLTAQSIEYVLGIPGLVSKNVLC
jgi:hypothetical protein